MLLIQDQKWRLAGNEQMQHTFVASARKGQFTNVDFDARKVTNINMALAIRSALACQQLA